MKRWEWTAPDGRVLIVYAPTLRSAMRRFAAAAPEACVISYEVRQLPLVEREAQLVVRDERKAPGA